MQLPLVALKYWQYSWEPSDMSHRRIAVQVWPPHTTSAYCPHSEISRRPRESHVGLQGLHTPSCAGPKP